MFVEYKKSPKGLFFLPDDRGALTIAPSWLPPTVKTVAILWFAATIPQGQRCHCGKLQ